MAFYTVIIKLPNNRELKLTRDQPITDAWVNEMLDHVRKIERPKAKQPTPQQQQQAQPAVFYGARSLCTCGHTGDSFPDGSKTQHAGMVGHGKCTMPGCNCVKFTWARFTDEYRIDVAVQRLRRAGWTEKQIDNALDTGMFSEDLLAKAERLAAGL